MFLKIKFKNLFNLTILILLSMIIIIVNVNAGFEPTIGILPLNNKSKFKNLNNLKRKIPNTLNVYLTDSKTIKVIELEKMDVLIKEYELMKLGFINLSPKDYFNFKNKLKADYIISGYFISTDSICVEIRLKIDNLKKNTIEFMKFKCAKPNLIDDLFILADKIHFKLTHQKLLKQNDYKIKHEIIPLERKQKLNEDIELYKRGGCLSF